MNRLARWTFAVPPLLLCCAALAQQSAPPPPELIERDRVAEQLRLESIRFGAAAQAVEDDALYPDFTRTSVYLGVELPGLMVSEATIRINDRPPVTVEVNDTEAYALLQSGGLKRMLRANLPPGAHSVHVLVKGKMNYAKGEAADFAMEETFDFDKAPKPTSILLYATRTESIRGRPGRTFREGVRSQPALDARVFREQPQL